MTTFAQIELILELIWTFLCLAFIVYTIAKAIR